MPQYLAGGSAPTLAPGMLTTIWNNEVPISSPPGREKSQQFGLQREGNFPSAVSIEVAFAANPGAFQLDFQTANTDAEKYYITKASVNSGLNPSFVIRFEVTNVVARFGRLVMVSLTNAVAVTATIC